MSKVGLAFALLAFDIAFEADFAASIAYGNAVFAYPAATEEIPGVAEIATQGEVDTGTDDQRFVTPKKLKARLQAILNAITGEATARSTADAALSGEIEDEATARHNADDDLAQALVSARRSSRSRERSAVVAWAIARTDPCT